MARWLSVAGSALMLGCSEKGTATKVAVPPRAMTGVELRAVAVAASLDLPLQASVYAWRDFMPSLGDSTDAHPLMISVQVRGGVVLPKVLECDAIYVVLADSVFSARPAVQRAGDGPGAIECLMRGGPEWAVGSGIHVIVGVGAGAQRTLIRRETIIDATS